MHPLSAPGVGGQVTLVAARGPTAIDVTWTVPDADAHNGILTSAVVSARPVQSSNNVSIADAETETVLVSLNATLVESKRPITTRVPGLDAFVVYNVFVLIGTAAGFSPPGALVQVRTAQGGTLHLCQTAPVFAADVIMVVIFLCFTAALFGFHPCPSTPTYLLPLPQFFLPFPVPSSVVALTARVVADDSVRLEWEAPVPARGAPLTFQIQQRDISQNQQSFVPIANAADAAGSVGSSRTHVVAGLRPLATYAFRIRAVTAVSGPGDSTGPGPFSQPVIVTLQSTGMLVEMGCACGLLVIQPLLASVSFANPPFCCCPFFAFLLFLFGFWPSTSLALSAFP